MSKPSSTDLTKFLLDQLAARNVRMKRPDNSGWLKVYCVKGHDKRTPSLSINKSSGNFSCFGCGIHGTWNVLAEMIGAEKLTEENAPDPFAQLHHRLRDSLEKEEEKELRLTHLPWDIKPWRKGWRDVGRPLMRQAQAHKWFDDTSRCYRILLPIYLYDENPVGWVARRLDKSKYTPYRNSESLSGIAKYTLYPYHIVATLQARTIVLVEGPYDALRLIDDGIPALSLLGVNNYDPSCHIHLHNLGVRRVIMGLDNDAAGKLGRKAIAPQVRAEFKVGFWHYRSKDPGDSTRRERRDLRTLL